jgi:hypothetical protein
VHVRGVAGQQQPAGPVPLGDPVVARYAPTLQRYLTGPLE